MARTKTKPVGRTPAKRKACEAWLLQQLAEQPCPARDILSFGSASGWGWATVRRAKLNVGAQSFRKNEEWWWFDPKKFDPEKDSPAQKPVQPSPKSTFAPALPELPEISAAISPKPVVHNQQPPVTFPALMPLA